MPTPPLSPANELGDIESSVSVNASEAMITEAAGRKVSPSEPTHTPPSTPATKQTLAVLGVTLAMLLAPALVESGRPEVARGAAVLGVMALWWVTEVLPLPITSLLPMVLYPLLGVCSASELSKVFFDATSMLFVAGFLVGLAVERWGMHRRIAFSVVALVGGGGMAALIAGFMGSTWLLSMMISNTATTLAMLPVADAFLASLPPGTERFQSGFLLAIGYAATIGGIATPVGTPTNAIFLSQYSLFWPDEPEFSFATFTLAALPLSGCLRHVARDMCTLRLARPHAPPGRRPAGLHALARRAGRVVVRGVGALRRPRRPHLALVYGVVVEAVRRALAQLGCNRAGNDAAAVSGAVRALTARVAAAQGGRDALHERRGGSLRQRPKGSRGGAAAALHPRLGRGQGEL